MMIAVVGSGGKTTRIHSLAAQYRAAGQRVLVTTTTHMCPEADTLLGDDPAAIRRRLERTGYCMAGQAGAGGKLCALSPETLAAAAAAVTLVEADGSRGLPVKFPAAHEPVIPPGTDRIEVVVGLSALGKPWETVSHRPALVQRCLGLAPGERLTPDHLRTLVRRAYLEPLRRQFPGVALAVCPGQVNTPWERSVAAFLRAEANGI